MTAISRPLLRRLAFFALAAISAASFAGQAQTRYRVIEIGALGGVQSYATGLNDFGVVVGNAQYRDGHTQAFLWDSLRGTLRIDPSADESVAFAINNSGQIAGAVEEDDLTDAVVWSKSFVPRSIAWAPFGAFATAINDRGEAVGYRRDGVFFFVDQAFAWPARDPNSAWADLFDDGSESFATDLNNRGQVVGYVDRQAFLAERNGKVRILAGDSSGGLPAVAVAISGVGHVLVSQVGTGYLFTNSKTYSISYSGPVNPRALNDSDVVVGSVSYGGTRAFVWEKTTGLLLLDNLLETSGWKILSANAINKSGMIAGQGIRNGRQRAVLLVPLSGPSAGPTP